MYVAYSSIDKLHLLPSPFLHNCLLARWSNALFLVSSLLTTLSSIEPSYFSSICLAILKASMTMATAINPRQQTRITKTNTTKGTMTSNMVTNNSTEAPVIMMRREFM